MSPRSRVRRGNLANVLRVTQVADPNLDRPKRRVVLAAISTLMAAGALVFAGVATFDLVYYSSYALPGESMEPTIRPGTHVWTRPVSGASVKPGEIVVLRLPSNASLPGSRAISRVVAVAGQTVTVRGGRLFVDGRDEGPAPIQFGGPKTITVPPDAVYVIGDNRPDTAGSNQYGPLPTENVDQHVVRIGAPSGANLALRLAGGLGVAALAGLICWRMLRRRTRVAERDERHDAGPRPLWSS